MAVYLRVRLTRVAVPRSTLIHLAECILAAAGEARSELSIELIGDQRMQRLNREYRRQDRVTDVLAFPTREAIIPQGWLPPTSMLGDVVISLPTAVRQARQARRSIDKEIAMLLIHGVLHLCGYDHERSVEEAARMSRRERAIFRRISPVPRIAILHARRPTRDC